MTKSEACSFSICVTVSEKHTQALIASTLRLVIDGAKKRKQDPPVLPEPAMEGVQQRSDDKAYMKLDLVGIGPLIRNAIED
jgi:hypothetical protein